MHEDTRLRIAECVREEVGRRGEVLCELREGAILEGELEPREGHVRGEQDAPAHRAEDMRYAELDEHLWVLGCAKVRYEEIG